jgi:glyoxylate reductase
MSVTSTRAGTKPLRQPPACVICTTNLPADLLAPLQPAMIVHPAHPDDGPLAPTAVAAALPTARALITQGELRIDAALLDRAPQLRIVANIARGYDNLDLAALTARDIWATNVPAAFAPPTAEVALGLMLLVARRLAEADRYVQSGAWDRFEPGRWDGLTLAGKTLGIIGLGQIGQEVARRAEAFGMAITYYQRTHRDDVPYRWRPFDDLLRAADIVSLHVPAMPATYRLVDARALALMKPGAMLINTARGSVVDEAALVAALAAGRLHGAGLDVVEHEPHVASQLLGHPRVVITPHLGGGTVESRHAAREYAIANVAAVLRGQRPRQPLNDLDAKQRRL